MLAAIAPQRGLVSATVFLDIVKYYKHISHFELLQAGLHAEFNRRYSARAREWCPRELSAGVSRELIVNGGVVAGRLCATSQARIMFLAVLKRAAACAPIITIKNAIDDISLHGVGGEKTVTQQLTRGYECVTHDAAASGMPIADRKTGLLANSAALAEPHS